MKMPEKVFVYVCDRDNDRKPIFEVATDLKEIPENCSKVGTYELVRTAKLKVIRELE